MKPKVLTIDQYAHLRSGGRVLESDGFGEKVILLGDGTFLKLFRRKRLISSALWAPYSERFIDNSVRLRNLGILAPEVLGFYKLPFIKRDLVHYRGVIGNTLRHLFFEEPLDSNTKTELLNFINELHDKGIFFRSLHSGNIIMGKSSFGLIDISNMQISKGPLSESRRKRNIKHITKDPILRDLFNA